MVVRQIQNELPNSQFRYEDLKFRGKDTLEKIASFLDLKYSDSQIATVLQMSSFNTMQQLERIYFEKNAGITSGRKQKADVPVVRSGQSRGWKDALTNKPSI